jgi:hypothetical protein
MKEHPYSVNEKKKEFFSLINVTLKHHYYLLFNYDIRIYLMFKERNYILRTTKKRNYILRTIKKRNYLFLIKK